jgi:predicted RecB family nuclease
LTKNDFLAGVQCHKQLWWRVHDPFAMELVPDECARALIKTGREVGISAREHVPGGQLISFRHQATSARISATHAAMANGDEVVYDATFSSDGLVIRVDILERAGDGWTLISVKSSLDVKEKHITDAAVQAHVLRRSGIDLRRIEIMHLNRDCRHPDLSNLFVRESITAKVTELSTDFRAEAEAQLLMLRGTLPEKTTGEHCSTPGRCPFWDRCWAQRPDYHVSTMYRSGQKAREWEQKGWQTIADLPESIVLNPVARRQMSAVRAGRIQVESTLSSALEAFAGPLAFLDFETVAPAIPRWNGCAPFTAVPVQLSCHLEDADGGWRHVEWLAEGPGDPRPELARFLVENCGDGRSIVAYNSAFEADCIRGLAEAVPGLATELRDMEHRLIDLLTLVREHVYHPSFAGSFSLKQVLPALVPGQQYHGMRIAKGSTASYQLLALLFGDVMDAQERSIIREELLAYCKQDTWAMVQLLRRIRELAHSS